MANFFVGVSNWLIKQVGLVFAFVFGLFPDTPFEAPAAPPNGVNLGYVTWLLDFPTWLSHLTMLLGAISIYYAARVLARWVKIARD